MARKYIVELNERWIQSVAVMADSPEEADAMVRDGGGAIIEADGYFNYADTDDEAEVREANQQDIEALGEGFWAKEDA